MHYERQYAEEAEKARKDSRYPRVCCDSGKIIYKPCIPHDHCTGSTPLKRKKK